jgi:hypothetical protein
MKLYSLFSTSHPPLPCHNDPNVLYTVLQPLTIAAPISQKLPKSESPAPATKSSTLTSETPAFQSVVQTLFLVLIGNCSRCQHARSSLCPHPLLHHLLAQEKRRTHPRRIPIPDPNALPIRHTNLRIQQRHLTRIKHSSLNIAKLRHKVRAGNRAHARSNVAECASQEWERGVPEVVAGEDTLDLV